MGGEGLWDTLPAGVADEVQQLSKQQRQDARNEKRARQTSEWDRQLDQGRMKKVKAPVEPEKDGGAPTATGGPNMFQQVQDERAKQKQLRLQPKAPQAVGEDGDGATSECEGERGSEDQAARHGGHRGGGDEWRGGRGRGRESGRGERDGFRGGGGRGSWDSGRGSRGRGRGDGRGCGGRGRGDGRGYGGRGRGPGRGYGGRGRGPGRGGEMFARGGRGWLGGRGGRGGGRG